MNITTTPSGRFFRRYTTTIVDTVANDHITVSASHRNALVSVANAQKTYALALAFTTLSDAAEKTAELLQELSVVVSALDDDEKEAPTD